MLQLYLDERVGGRRRYYIAEKPDHIMRVPDQVLKCAAFVGYKRGDNDYVKLGTAFFVSVPFSDDWGEIYCVTAKHILAKIRGIPDALERVYVRVNTQEGFEWVETPLAAWKGHPDDYRVDVVAIPFPVDEPLSYVTIPISMAATDDIIDEEQIGPGDAVFLTGLFSKHYGNRKNLPIVRTGNIAMMPLEPVEVKIGDKLDKVDAYLIEARSIGGLSGSPVFVEMGTVRSTKTVKNSLRGHKYYWLGLMRGHWDTTVKNDDLDEDDDALVPPEEKVNMGIAIVVPVSKILEVLNQPDFAETREREAERLRMKDAPTDDVAEEPAESAFTEDDFEDALRKVSRPVPRDSETSETSG